MNDPINTITPPAKKSWLRRYWPHLAVGVALVMLGAMIGSAGASAPQEAAQPQPVKTVEVEVEVPAEVDAGCSVVAEELMAILGIASDEVMIPQNEIIGVLVSNLQYGVDVDEINAATVTLNEITDATTTMTSRTEAITAEYQRCVNP